MPQPVRHPVRDLLLARQPTGPGATTAAGRVLVTMVVALSLVGLLASKSVVHLGEGMQPGRSRSVVLSVAHPVDRVASLLSLDRPMRGVDRLLGRSGPTGPSLLAPVAVSAPAPVMGPGPQPALTPPGPGPGPDAQPPGRSAGDHPLRVATADSPLRVLAIGDSLMGPTGPQLSAAVAALGVPATTRTVSNKSTGLVRPDYFDWAVEAQAQVAKDDPDVVFVMIGGNEAQGIGTPQGPLTSGTPEWQREYQRRAEVVMRIFAGDHRQVYWLGMPPARSTTVNRAMTALNSADAAAAAAVPGVTFLDTRPVLTADGTSYTDSLPGADGSLEVLRDRDGIHVTSAGAARIATLGVGRLRTALQPG